MLSYQIVPLRVSVVVIKFSRKGQSFSRGVINLVTYNRCCFCDLLRVTVYSCLFFKLDLAMFKFISQIQTMLFIALMNVACFTIHMQSLAKAMLPYHIEIFRLEVIFQYLPYFK